MVKSRYFTKTQEFDGMPKVIDFKIVEEEIDDDLKDKEILGEAIYISVDPYTRYAVYYNVPPGAPIIGFQVIKVTKSKNPKYFVGEKIMVHGGWRTTCKVDDEQVWYKVDKISGIDTSVFVGALGMPGMTAYCGFLEICQPKEGETVFVNGCAGAVGNLVGQIAKIKGCKVIGCCGSDEKIKFAKSIGFDDVFNYKTCKDYPGILKKMAPNGVDCFFDNVGGRMSTDVLACMNVGGRISVCGAISAYNSKTLGQGLSTGLSSSKMLRNQLLMRGFGVGQFKDKFPEALKHMIQWIQEGKLKIHETTTKGFENTPQAFIDMLSGGNIGKA
uniref:Prostaglandin reductase 1 n=1 Tax=Ciona savignyi TaxID=51511 RepID=H2ZPX2_CIOSA